MERYVQLTKELNTVDALIVLPNQISFDNRALLKCRRGCEDFLPGNIRCDQRETTYLKELKC
jgi:predicted metal-binding protein